MRYWLIEKREKKDISQSNLAKEVGISRQMMSSIEHGKRRPSPEVAQKIADILEFDWNLFFKIA